MCMVFVLFDVFYVKMRKTNKESYKKKKKKKLLHTTKRPNLTICSADVECEALLWAHLQRCALPAEHVQSALISTH